MFLSLLVLPAFSYFAQAQTVLVSPSGAGGFELGSGSFTDNGWAVTTSAANNWYVGQGKTSGSYSFPSTSNCAFVSNNGTDWQYAASTNQAIHFYRDVVFPAGETQAVLSFRFQQRGNNARLMVFLADSNMTPALGVPNSGSISVGAGAWGGSGSPVMLTNTYTDQAAGTVSYTISIPPSAIGNCSKAVKKRLVFTWNNSTTATNPPAAVDEISLVSRTPVPASSVNFTINSGLPTGGTNFQTFTDAISWINAAAYCGLPNAVTINVPAGQVFNEDVPAIRAAGTAGNTITFRKTGTGANPQIIPSGNAPSVAQNPGTVDYGMCLLGSRYVTIDGIDITASNDRIEYGYFVGIASETQGSSYNTIKNAHITLDRTNTASKGILQSAANISGYGTGINIATAINANGANNYNKYYNLTISNVYTGIVLYGASTNIPDLGNRIGVSNPGEFNVIGSPAIPNDIGGSGTIAGAIGINAQNQQNVSIFNNRISNVTGSGSNPIEGISLGAYSSASATWNGIGGFENEIYNNIITGIYNASATATGMASGIRITHDAILGMVKVRIYNNVISRIGSAYAGSSSTVRGIRGISLQSSSSVAASIYEVVNNTVIIDGSTSPNLSNTVMEGAFNGSMFVIRNNLFANKTAGQSGSATHSILGVTGATGSLGAQGSTSDYNDFYLQNPANGLISFIGNTATLAAWRTYYTGQNFDVNSISADPVLNSDDVLLPLYASPLLRACPSLSTPYDHDVLGNRRNATQSTIGAYEKAGDVIPPSITDTTLLGTTTLGNRILNDLLVVTDQGSIVATSAGSAPRIYFKKSTDADVFGANTSAANGWKWVEATNTTSPFSFTINYGLLQTPVSGHDVIQYFFVAQDTVATPNVSASPSAGFSGSSVANITSAPASPKSYIIYLSPAPFVSASVSQGTTAKVITGSVNQQIIRLAVETGSTGDSAYVTRITFQSTGINDGQNIRNAKVWYTGSDPVFATGTQFGSTYTPSGNGPLGTFSIDGGQIIAPDTTSYFWLSYDMETNGIPFDSVDASVVSLVYDNMTQLPGSPSAAGSRIIKAEYCMPASTGTYGITNVTFNTLNNTSALSATPFYTNYAATGNATTVLKKGALYNLSVTTNNSSSAVVAYIDYNDDGNFDPNEMIATVPFTTSGVPVTVPVVIPCNAVTSSEVRMRVRAYYYSNATNGCTTAQPGEAEDYTLTIQDNVPAYVSSSGAQAAGTVAGGAVDKVVMRLAVVAGGCGTGPLDAVYASTAGTTAAPDIIQARLYATGTSKQFTPSNLLATIGSPSGQFIFGSLNSNLSLVPGDTSYFWITYDLATSPAVNNSIDARLDSISLFGEHRIPSNNDPSAVLTVVASNTYASSSASNPDLARVPRVGQQNSPVMRIRIVTTSGGAPMYVSQFNLTTNGGGNDTANIASSRIYYTGNVNAFSPETQFGTPYTPVAPTTSSWAPYAINGSQYLQHDTNYFWLAYDIKSSAINGDSVDAELTSFVLNGTPTVPTTSTLPGNLKISLPYCKVSFSGLGTTLPNTREEISRVVIGTLDNASTCLQTGGVESELNIYSNYSEIIAPLNIKRNEPTSFTLTGLSNCGSTTATATTAFSIYADLNQDGDFDDAGENLYRSTTIAGVLTGRTVSGSIVIPCTASLGLTRLRVIYAGGNPVQSACGTLGQFGEVEDYTINIGDNPLAYSAAVATQNLQTVVAPGFTDVMAMRIAIKANGCGTGSLPAMYFGTSGSTNAADIAGARLYTTGTTAQFVNPVLLSTASVSGGQLSFTTMSGSIENNSPSDSNYFWLVCDISGAATVTNIVDVTLDSLNIAGTMRMVNPAQGNPAGNLLVAGKMSYVGVSAIHPDLNPVSMGVKNRQILRVLVASTANGAPVTLSSLQFSTAGGGNDLANIDSARVFFTGRNATFSTAVPFGAAYGGTTNPWGTFTINGSQALSADTNYFWLVYDIKNPATLFDSVDASLVSLVFDGLTQNASIAPAGVITIKNEYCASVGFSASSPLGTLAFNITNVRLNTLNNTSACATTSVYANNTASVATSLLKGGLSTIRVKTTRCGTSIIPLETGYFTMYIDYDQSGDFTANELVYSSNVIIADTVIGNFLVPCDAKPGQTRMRLIVSSNTPQMSPCGTANATTGYGETEDYLINIVDGGLTFVSSAASQENGLVARGKNDQVIMKFNVKTSGCGTGEMNRVHLSTSGSTSPASDILAAKLYKTPTDQVFANQVLLGTYNNPSGVFDFTLNDTLKAENNYWLVYDIAPGATLNNTLDVRIDSIQVFGQYRIPANNDPSQARTIDAPMSVSDVFAIHSGSDRAVKGSSFAILNMQVVASAGSPLSITRFDLNTLGGGADTANILSARIYYTGNSRTFAGINQFGSTYTAGSAVSGSRWNAFSINGSANLAPDTNHFWLVYQLSASAVNGDSIDAQLASVRIDNASITPSAGNPAGNALISDNYCIPGPISGRCIDTVIIGGINHAAGTTCATPWYTFFPASGNTTASMNAGSSVPVRLTFAQATRVSIFIDLDRNGIFELTEEYNIAPSVNVPDITTSIFIPATAVTGQTRMRVRTFGGQSTGMVTNRACNDWNQSSTHDYVITILPAIPPTTYVWNQTTAASFNTATNWTPARTSASPTDRLIFPASANELVVTNVTGQTVSTIDIAAGNRVSFQAQGSGTLTISDSLVLGNNALMSTNSNLGVQIGETSTKPGVVELGTDAGINARVTRMIGAANSTNVVFPLMNSKGSKKVTLDYGSNQVFGSVTAEFVSSNPAGSGGLPLYEGATAVSVNRIANSGYWEITPSSDLTPALYSATFEADSFINVQNSFMLVLVNRISSFNNWTLNGNHLYNLGNNDRPVLLRTSMYGYGQFAIGSDSIFNQLPVKLLEFKGAKAAGDVILTWSTANETNNKGFEVQRSFDGKSFETIGFVDGNGTSASINRYAYTDKGVLGLLRSGSVHYRLRQTDLNGAASFSSTVSIDAGQARVNGITYAVYPNPFSSEVYVNISNASVADCLIEVFDMTGKKAIGQTLTLAEGDNRTLIRDAAGLQSGVYFISVSINGNREVFKLVKQ